MPTRIHGKRVVKLMYDLPNDSHCPVLFWSDKEVEERKAPCECSICERHYRPKKHMSNVRLQYAVSVRYDLAKAFLKYFISRARNDRKYISDMLESHGNTIVGRWKKSANKRTK
jgi:hypothetical protein